jgi:hypothetical protein
MDVPLAAACIDGVTLPDKLPLIESIIAFGELPCLRDSKTCKAKPSG